MCFSNHISPIKFSGHFLNFPPILNPPIQDFSIKEYYFCFCDFRIKSWANDVAKSAEITFTIILWWEFCSKISTYDINWNSSSITRYTTWGLSSRKIENWCRKLVPKYELQACKAYCWRIESVRCLSLRKRLIFVVMQKINKNKTSM